MLGLILGAIVIGLLVGALARLALPGKDPMSIPMTIGVGIGGSLIASIVVYLLTDGERAPGFFASFVGAVLIMYFIRRSRGGGLTSPGAAEDSRSARIP
jgi:uncharacterized membrane protein YeaQ/YmgE (transglycosylase-associated protein family)